MPKTKLERVISAGRFSARSQRMCAEIYRLKSLLAKVSQSIAISVRNRARLAKDCDHFSRPCAVQGPVWKGPLTTKLVDLEAEKRMLAAYKEEDARLCAQIEKLENPTPAEPTARRQNQELLASLTEERKIGDVELARRLEGVKELLIRRRKLSGRMTSIASLIDLNVGIDWMDIARFDELLNYLPDRLAEQSSDWMSAFLGKPQATTAYPLIEPTLTLPETLASAHFYVRGETVQPTKEQAAVAFPKYEARQQSAVDMAQDPELAAWEKSLSV